MQETIEKDKLEVCKTVQVHEDVVQMVTEELPDESQLYSLADLFKNFGDSTRLKILFVLMEVEMCVCDLAQVLGMSQSAISHQLRVLKSNKLVKSRRDGKQIFYSLDDDHVRGIICQGMDHVSE